jgi:hypothetical protein
VSLTHQDRENFPKFSGVIPDLRCRNFEARTTVELVRIAMLFGIC